MTSGHADLLKGMTSASLHLPNPEHIPLLTNSNQIVKRILGNTDLWAEEPGGLQSMGSLRVGHDWATSLSLCTLHFDALEKEMATHSSVLAWRIPGMGVPGGLPPMGSRRVGHDWSDLAAAAAAAGVLNKLFKRYQYIHSVPFVSNVSKWWRVSPSIMMSNFGTHQNFLEVLLKSC